MLGGDVMAESLLEPTISNKLGMAVHPSFALLAGMKLDLFTPLQNGPLSAEEIARSLGVGEAKLRPLLYALAATDLLTVEEGRFANTPEADDYLVRGRPAYLGQIHELWSWLWGAELQTAESVSTGIPQAKYDFTAMSEEELEAFYRGTIAGAAASGRDLLALFDFSAARSLLDAGGGSGGLSIALTESLPQLKATVIDQPTVTPFTRRFVENAGQSDSINVVSGDIVRHPIAGQFDAAVMRAVVQVLSPQDARAAIRNVGAAIKPDGFIAILGIGIIDDSRLSPPKAVAYNLVFLNVYDEGMAYTEGEYREWLEAAGFTDVQRHLLADGYSVIVAQKSGVPE
jgi:SAM-dependent methyltransferase